MKSCCGFKTGKTTSTNRQQRELERRAYDCQARSKIAKMIVRIVALEGLQPRVTEAFMRENEIKNGGA